jgi:hypothetical protein
MEMEQKGPKLVDARGMAMRLHAEKAVSAEEEQEWQVLMESVGWKSGSLERVSAWNGNGQETVEKTITTLSDSKNPSKLKLSQDESQQHPQNTPAGRWINYQQ